MIVVIEIDNVLGNLGETPYDPLKEEKDEDATGESFTDKQLSMLNETLIHFFKEPGNRNLLEIHLGVNYPKLMTTM